MPSGAEAIIVTQAEDAQSSGCKRMSVVASGAPFVKAAMAGTSHKHPKKCGGGSSGSADVLMLRLSCMYTQQSAPHSVGIIAGEKTPVKTDASRPGEHMQRAMSRLVSGGWPGGAPAAMLATNPSTIGAICRGPMVEHSACICAMAASAAPSPPPPSEGEGEGSTSTASPPSPPPSSSSLVDERQMHWYVASHRQLLRELGLKLRPSPL